MYVCMYAIAHIYIPYSIVHTDLISTFSNLLETRFVTVVETLAGWCSAMVVTIQDPVVDDIGLPLSLPSLPHAVKDGQYCALSRTGQRRSGQVSFRQGFNVVQGAS